MFFIIKAKHSSLVALLVLALNFASYAQMPGGGVNQGTIQTTPPNLGHVYGKLVDSATGKAIEGASVLILQATFDSVAKKQKEVLVKGGTTKTSGEFNFEELPVRGKLVLKISATGYKPIDKSISFLPDRVAGMNKPLVGGQPPVVGAMPSFDKDLGKLALVADVQQMQAVVVTATSSRMKLDIDKKVYNVDKDVTNAGGTALDVMKNVPSVQVDIDGNVTMRNSAPQLYLDGRPTTLTLEQIPADAIESVEVITNPSAKFDASGGNAGILNIVLKKNKKTGYNGNVRAGVDKYGAVNGGGDFNVRQGKVNVSASAHVNQMKGKSTGTAERVNLSEIPETALNQSSSNTSTGGFLFGRLGLDYYLNNKTTFSLSGIRMHGSFTPDETIHTSIDSLFNTGVVNSAYQRLSTGSRVMDRSGLQFGYRQLFAKKGEELTADGQLSTGKNSNKSNYTTRYKDGNEYENVIGEGTNRFLTMQTDYVNPLSGVAKLEAGLRAQIRNVTNNTETYLQDLGSAEMVKVAAAVSNYKNQETVYAGYLSLSSSIKNFGYQLGLRAESSEYTGELMNSGEKFSNQYAISLFPSLFLSQKLANRQELQFSYTRRINRPNFFQLIPYTDRTDKLNIMQGNPDLKPEFTNSLELSYNKAYAKNNNILASLYYKRTTDLITRYQQQAIDPVSGNEEIISTFINAAAADAYGAELTAVNYITPWWDATTNVNIYNSKITTSKTDASTVGMWSWFGKLNNNFRLPHNFTFQLAGNYQSKTNLPVNNNSREPGGPMMQAQSAAQGYIKSFYSIDAGLKKSFLKNNVASLTLSVNDLFKTRTNEQYSANDYFMQTYSRINNPQLFRLTFAYRFGKLDMSLFKRKSNQNETMQGAAEMMN